jgi:uncharacterized protein YjbJ (UPF0337 family)
MNKDIFEGKWKQLRGEIRGWWGKLTDNDVDKINGRFDVFIGLLQERYGYTHEQAEDELDKQLKEYQIWLKKKGLPAL